jgi:hypothetical protein
MKNEYHQGPKVREDFERTMKALFQVRKADLKTAPKPKRKRRATSKD